jgi:hypothetical protein
MQEPEYFAACDLGPGIHLPRTPARDLQDAICQTNAQLGRAIIAPAIDDNDFGAWSGGAKVQQKCANQLRFIESGHYDRNRWPAHDSMFCLHFARTFFPSHKTDVNASPY